MNFRTKDNRVWFYRIMTFFAVPVFLMSVALTDKQTILERTVVVWLIISGGYVVLLSALAIANRPSEGQAKWRSTPVQLIVNMFGSVVWGGFFTIIYFFVYWLIFSRENLSPQ